MWGSDAIKVFDEDCEINPGNVLSNKEQYIKPADLFHYYLMKGCGLQFRTKAL
jgi:hypothetical protein